MSSPQQDPRHTGSTPPAGGSTPPTGASPYGVSYPAPTSQQGPPAAYGVGQQIPQPGAQGGPPAPGGATGELVIELRKPPGAMGMISPAVTIDGYPAPCQWGRNSFPAPVGVRRVEIAQVYMWAYGQASLSVTVEPGRTETVYYSGPLLTFGMAGAIGTEPQKRPGRTVFVVLMTIAAVAILLGILAAIVGNS